MTNSERRRTPRVETEWNVTVRDKRAGLLHGRAQNISEHGMFIALTGGADLVHDVVEVRMYRDDVMLCMRGVVVHHAQNGIGLLLREPVLMYELIEGAIYEVTPLAAAA